ncbi:MAG: oxidoreductase [Actinomycetota bacterium]|nr:oxidoreductase [Actinomycetota bacterium]
MPRWTAADLPDQRGRTVLVTGATSGLGLRSAEALAATGARVLLAGRQPAKLAGAVERVRQVASGAAPEGVALDLTDLRSVRAAAEEVDGRVDRLDVLMNNAGVMAVPKASTADGFESQLGTNHLGHVALTAQLLPALLRAPAPRVVTTSSVAHRTGRMRWDDLQWERGRYSRWAAYGQSKLANLLFAFELDRRAARAGTALCSVAAHPGYAATHLQQVGPQLEGNKVKQALFALANVVVAQSDVQGALPQLYVATMPDVRGGEYWGPDGPGEVRGHPKRVGASRAATDEAAAARLWDLSQELTGTTFSWPPAP